MGAPIRALHGAEPSFRLIRDSGRESVGGDSAIAEDAPPDVRWGHLRGLLRLGPHSVEAITWWDLADKRSWLGTNALLRDDFSPKPAYRVLDRLINREWHTRADGVTDASGGFRFRGFYGEYRVGVRAAKARRATSHLFHLGGASRGEWLVTT